ncbi:unnamed protein product [Parnassius apollo]|uniref:(apollo) hypothetical protein n=1 Tax=Parnassius apollo TaxID=110799 RepID=A0A8S3WC71_PARAO|nr:unnamed protein product [Parnassius apollo]
MDLQLQCFNIIKSLCSNYKKDGASGKTEEYLLSRIQSIDDQWIDIEQRHKIVVETVEDKNIDYFTGNVFTKTKELYETTLQSMQYLLLQVRKSKSVHFDPTGMLDGTTDVSVKTLLEQQECNF